MYNIFFEEQMGKIPSGGLLAVGDDNHLSPYTYSVLTQKIPELKKQGLTDLYLELDPKEFSVNEIADMGERSLLSPLVKAAQTNGIQVHFIDDHSQIRELNHRFPEEAAIVKDVIYTAKKEELLAQAPNRERMEEYLDQLDERMVDNGFRNRQMATNIADDLDKKPNAKGLFLGGVNHLGKPNDMDEMLEARGHPTVTVHPVAVHAFSQRNDVDFEYSHGRKDVVQYRDPETCKMNELALNAALPDVLHAHCSGASSVDKGDLGNISRFEFAAQTPETGIVRGGK